MYKNGIVALIVGLIGYGFNPCFNGTMYKNSIDKMIEIFDVEFQYLF